MLVKSRYNNAFSFFDILSKMLQPALSAMDHSSRLHVWVLFDTLLNYSFVVTYNLPNPLCGCDNMS